MKQWKFNDRFCFEIYSDEPLPSCSALIMGDSGDNKIRYKELYERVFTEKDRVFPEFVVPFDELDDEKVTYQSLVDYWNKQDPLIEMFFFRANVEYDINFKWGGTPRMQKIGIVSTISRFIHEITDADKLTRWMDSK